MQLSSNTQAILMLTGALGAGRSATKDALTQGEYKRLARRLQSLKREPADLFGPSAVALLDECATDLDAARVLGLLERGFLLSQAVERWNARAIWVLSRADVEYPKRLKAQLGDDAPPILYGCGARNELDGGGLAVVGSRAADHELLQLAQSVGRQAATARVGLVSGGAKGVDAAAMQGAIAAGGRALGVVGDSLERLAMHREHREALRGGQLTLLSLVDPSAGFHVGHAMQRNKAIYALADAALIVQAEKGKGGTWAGAEEQLSRYHFVPIYVRATGPPSEGLSALRKLGALAWPEPQDAPGFADAFKVPRPVSGSKQPRMSFEAQAEEAPSKVMESIQTRAPESQTRAEQKSSTRQRLEPVSPSDSLYQCARTLILEFTIEPTALEIIAKLLAVPPALAKQWLERLVQEGKVRKLKKPVRYQRAGLGLF